MTTDAILHDYYPRLLFPRGFGYPLYKPDCGSNRDLDIGCVGVVREGRFDVLSKYPYTTRRYTEIRDIKTKIWGNLLPPGSRREAFDRHMDGEPTPIATASLSPPTNNQSQRRSAGSDYTLIEGANMRRTHIHPSKHLAQFVVNHLCARTDLDEVMFVVGTTQGLGSVQWQLTAEVDGKRDVRLVRAYGATLFFHYYKIKKRGQTRAAPSGRRDYDPVDHLLDFMLNHKVGGWRGKKPTVVVASDLNLYRVLRVRLCRQFSLIHHP
ncbi:hypothetical protein C8Q76DRAFT_316987 [Earliella scabrosa]|nr:hypothetical protein C8Q76DRAFT_316987 [Earliella scabrosa]